jgi:hypothetical protein
MRNQRATGLTVNRQGAKSAEEDNKAFDRRGAEKTRRKALTAKKSRKELLICFSLALLASSRLNGF